MTCPGTPSKQDSVLEILKDNGNQVTPSGRDYLIRCLNPDHDDTNPSLRVDRNSGVFNCLSCGFKGNIFKYYGVFTDLISVRVTQLKSKLNKVKTEMLGLQYPAHAAAWNTEYRGISVATLKHFNAFKVTAGNTDLADRIIFPLPDITGKIRAFIGRHTLSNFAKRYYIFPSKVAMPMLPAMVDQSYESIILVEGIFDMLNLWDNGLRNVVCCFGTNGLTANNVKTKLAPYRTAGITTVTILFDGDAAGREAAKKLRVEIQGLEIKAKVIHLRENEDPGMLSAERLQELKLAENM